MQKVKVTRYVSGRRPEWADDRSDSESSGDEEEGLAPPGHEGEEEPLDQIQIVQPDEEDRRLRRLKERGVLDLDRWVGHCLGGGGGGGIGNFNHVPRYPPPPPPPPQECPASG